MIFEKNKPQRCKIGIKNKKNEVKTFYVGDHICTWTVILKKKVFTLFSNQRAARGFNSFFESGPSCEKFAHPWFIVYELHMLVLVILFYLETVDSRERLCWSNMQFIKFVCPF